MLGFGKSRAVEPRFDRDTIGLIDDRPAARPVSLAMKRRVAKVCGLIFLPEARIVIASASRFPGLTRWLRMNHFQVGERDWFNLGDRPVAVRTRGSLGGRLGGRGRQPTS